MSITWLDVVQGSHEWIEARLGIPTASDFDQLITPKTRKPSGSAGKYLAQLLAEWKLGRSVSDRETGWMLRGSKLESEAIGYYQFERDTDTTIVGFGLRDDRMVGCSPDRLVGDKGILEMKCPALETHIGYLLDGRPSEYNAQIQGILWLAEREWADFMSYCPGMPPFLERVERDEDFIAALEKAVNAFVARLLKAREDLTARGVESPSGAPASIGDRSYGKALEEAGVTDADWQ